MAEYRITFSNDTTQTVAGDRFNFDVGQVVVFENGEPIFWADADAILHIRRLDTPKHA